MASPFMHPIRSVGSGVAKQWLIVDHLCAVIYRIGIQLSRIECGGGHRSWGEFYVCVFRFMHF